VTPEDPASEPAPVPEESHNGGSQTGAEQLTTHSHSPKGPKHGKGRGHHQGNGDQAETEHGGGPPPWAPAHGWRCQQAGNAPGSAAFHECIKAQKG
jgi:hypothetical protein